MPDIDLTNLPGPDLVALLSAARTARQMIDDDTDAPEFCVVPNRLVLKMIEAAEGLAAEYQRSAPLLQPPDLSDARLADARAYMAGLNLDQVYALLRASGEAFAAHRERLAGGAR